MTVYQESRGAELGPDAGLALALSRAKFEELAGLLWPSNRPLKMVCSPSQRNRQR